ncbi:MAG: hypothetical protein WBP86_02925 [Thiobacillaceae bacterium]
MADLLPVGGFRGTAGILREVELALAAAQSEANRVDRLEKALQDRQDEVSRLNRDYSAKAAEVGRLEGQLNALQSHIHDLMLVLGPNKPGTANTRRAS